MSIRPNESGGFEVITPSGFGVGRQTISISAAELRAAGIVLVSVDDARLALTSLIVDVNEREEIGYTDAELEPLRRARDNLRTAIGEQP